MLNSFCNENSQWPQQEKRSFTGPKSLVARSPEASDNSDNMSRPRWNKEETAALAEIRDTLRDELDSVEQNIEVVGDRSLIRFYRGHLGVMPTVCQMISNYLKWRKENGVDEV